MSTRSTYTAECFECEWTDPNARGTASARRHRDATGHTTACAVERDHIYRGTDRHNRSEEGGND